MPIFGRVQWLCSAYVTEPFRGLSYSDSYDGLWPDRSFLLEVEVEGGLESRGEVGAVADNTMNVNGGRPTCLYNDPSVFVKTEFDTGNHQAEYDTNNFNRVDF